MFYYNNDKGKDIMKEILPLISVVVLSYNNFDKIERTLHSILKQTYHNIELIISDDASEIFDENKVRKICESMTSNVKNVIVNVNLQNEGTVKNLNNAVRLSHGEFISVLASEDCYHDKDTLCRIVEFMNSDYELDIGVAKICPVNQAGESVADTRPSDVNCAIIKHSGEQLLEYLYINGNIMNGAGACYRKSSIEKYKLFDTDIKLVEDFTSFLCVLQGGGKISLMPFIAVDYFVGDVPSKKTYSSGVINDLLKIDEKYVIPQAKFICAKSIIKRRQQYWTAQSFLQKLCICLRYPAATIIVKYYKYKIQNRCLKFAGENEAQNKL